MSSAAYEVTPPAKLGIVFWFRVLLAVGVGVSVFVSLLNRTEMQRMREANEKELGNLARKNTELEREVTNLRVKTERQGILGADLEQRVEGVVRLFRREMKAEVLRLFLGPKVGDTVTLTGILRPETGKGGNDVFGYRLCIDNETFLGISLKAPTPGSQLGLKQFEGKTVEVSGVLHSESTYDFSSLGRYQYFYFAEGHYQVRPKSD
jgi:hypothetical protein